MQTPDWEDIVNAAENVGISRLSIIAYGYYGSRATGLATPESDEDIFVVIDTTVQKDEKMNISDACDIKFISAKEWPTNADFLFDIIAIGNIIFPKQRRNVTRGRHTFRTTAPPYILQCRVPSQHLAPLISDWKTLTVAKLSTLSASASAQRTPARSRFASAS